MRRALSVFLVLAMLSTVGISALAFAMTSDESTGLDVACTESVYSGTGGVDINDSDVDEATYPDADDAYVDTSYEGEVPELAVTNTDADDAYAGDGFIGIEPATITPGHPVAIANFGGGADTSFPTFAAAIAAATAGDTIFLLDNVTHAGPAWMPPNGSTLDLREYDLTIGQIHVFGSPGHSFTVISNGGTLYTTGATGFLATHGTTATINANIVANFNGVTAGGMGTGTGNATITINGNVSFANLPPMLPSVWTTGLLAQHNSTIVLTGNVTTPASSGAIGAVGALEGQITIYGAITAPLYVGFPVWDGTTYVLTIKDITDNDPVPVPGREDYTQYSHENAFVWVYGTSEPPAALTVISVTPANPPLVVITTDSLVVTFAKPVDPASAGTVTIDGTAVLGVGVWNSDFTVLTFPLSGLQYDTTYNVVVDGFVAADGGVMEAPFLHSFTTEPEPAGPGPGPGPGHRPDPGQPQPSRPSAPGTGTALPKTGDSSNAFVWALVLASSTLLAIAMLCRSRKEKCSEAF